MTIQTQQSPARPHWRFTRAHNQLKQNPGHDHPFSTTTGSDFSFWRVSYAMVVLLEIIAVRPRIEVRTSGAPLLIFLLV
jgi:hypothetical protein